MKQSEIGTLRDLNFTEPMPNVKTHPFFCKICTDVVQVIGDAYTSDQNIAHIEKLLNLWCDVLVGLEDECKAFVSENVEKVVDLLVNEYYSPDKVCQTYLHLCPATK